MINNIIQIVDIAGDYWQYSATMNEISGTIQWHGTVGAEFVRTYTGATVREEGVVVTARDSKGRPKMGPVLLNWDADALTITRYDGSSVVAGAWKAYAGSAGESSRSFGEFGWLQPINYSG